MKSGTCTTLPVSRVARFLHVVGAVASDALGGLGDLERYRRGKLDLGRPPFDAEHLHLQVLNEVVLGVRHEVPLKRDRIVGIRIDEMVTLRIAVAELQLLAVHIDEIDLLGRRKPHVGRLSRC